MDGTRATLVQVRESTIQNTNAKSGIQEFFARLRSEKDSPTARE
jgi:hypothetical protein